MDFWTLVGAVILGNAISITALTIGLWLLAGFSDSRISPLDNP